MSDDLIKEVEEEQRLLRLRSIALRVGGVFAVLLVLAGISGGVWGWQQHRLHTAQAAASDRYFEAMQLLGDLNSPPSTASDARQKAEGIFSDLAQSAPQGVRSYAAMYLAELKEQDHDHQAALALWQQVADDGASDESLRMMAQYRVLNGRMTTAPRDELRRGYQALVQTGGSWTPLAKEGLAVLDLRDDAKPEERAEARRLLLEVQASPDSTDDLRQRAGMLLQTLGEAG
ncbi:tetratricopeptide repeat protein [Bombella intestini]|uniref:tetratricopeptide repeat protein n=1 Tax=Bombella intestini TaxID=1539051 RepID=UPI0013012A4C|nr:tetratricopeptide repeat protein [Bombella intestini]